MPRFTYILSKDNQPVSHLNKIWNALLPTDRQLFVGEDKIEPASDHAVSYKDYFQAARTFLQRNSYAVLAQAVASRLKRTVKPDEFEDVRICLEKHGQFYHPSRVEVLGRKFTAVFVLNVAVSITGRTWIEVEFNTIRTLKKKFAEGYLPAVHAWGEVPVKGKDYAMPMFLGEWFEDFHEFHVSWDPEKSQHRVVVWDYRRGDFFLTPAQAVNLYRQAAYILTFYYNPDTFEQIFSWHHAAGDFVVKLENGRMNVRLITVRQYLKLFNPSVGSEKKATLAIKALLIFFLHLTIRMRLDRLDGTGPVTWLGLEALAGTMKGFFEALKHKRKLHGLAIPLMDGLKAYLYTLTENELLGLLSDITQTYSLASPDLPTIQAHLAQHAADLYREIHTDLI